MKVIRISHFALRSIGHGGFHRAYQIQHDLQRAVGQDNIITFDDPWGYFPPRPKNWFTRVLQDRRKTAARYVENPYNLLAETPFSTKRFEFPRLLARYEQVVASLKPPVICVIEHAGFASVININRRYRVPTIICPQNLESYDLGTVDYKNKWELRGRAIDFANELDMFAQCTERLFISKVETGLIGGLGLTSHYYPYVPVGIIRERLVEISHERQKDNVEPDLFLIIGTAGHDSTRASFKWFIQNAQAYGLPAGVRVVFAGRGTEKLLGPGVVVPQLELRGWVEQDELDRLLTRARAVLIPQLYGLGALTRLPELTCAGVPVIVSRHASLAIDCPPNVTTVADVWEDWQAAIQQITSGDPSLSHADYVQWESRQSQTLGCVVQQMLESSTLGRQVPGSAVQVTADDRPAAPIRTKEEFTMDDSNVPEDEVTTLRRQLARLEAEREHLMADYTLARRTLVDISNSRAYHLLKRAGRWKWLDSVLAQLPDRDAGRP